MVNSPGRSIVSVVAGVVLIVMSHHGFADEAATAIDAANKSIESANKAIESADKAIEVANTARNAAEIAQEAAKQARESAKSTMSNGHELNGIKMAIDELRQAIQNQQNFSDGAMPAEMQAPMMFVPEAVRTTDCVEKLIKDIADLKRIRQELDGFLQSSGGNTQDCAEKLEDLEDSVKDLHRRMDDLLNRPQARGTGPGANREVLELLLSILKPPADAEEQNMTTGTFTSVLFVTTPVGDLDQYKVYVNGTAVEMKPGSTVQRVELEFRSSPTICDVRIGLPYSYGGLVNDQRQKRFYVEPGKVYLVDSSDLKSNTPQQTGFTPYAAQAALMSLE